ncbi:unnamed protein product [Brachionus calyciflorus]|uniref:AAA+ ATPase domain-containing protein n=1 Tax=Brachionus calyciflorus TaxID=104777 RepID=A0A813YNK3_9BILA|nr:unnamed protein product [Brachionus calyciflorus]
MQDSVYEIWNSFSEKISNFNGKLFSSINTTENQRNVFFDPAKFNIIESSPTSSTTSIISKPILATREYIQNNQKQILSILARILGLTISAATTYFLMKWLMKNLDPTNTDKVAAKKRAEKIMKLVGIADLDLNEHELFIASNLILPSDIECSWQDIGGLDHIIEDLRETVIYPLKNFETFPNNNSTNLRINKRSKLIQPPKGVLFFGPPGNAKTMIAKALAKESGARFINLQVSSLFDKWYGESQKRTEAVFTLASKVQPVIIFIDEIDSFLRNRRSDDHECTSTMKTQFMTLWDGLSTNQNSNRILIVGATNRPEDVDPAILRRMPQMFHIGLPSKQQRNRILQVILKDEALASDVDLDEIAESTDGYSGSDLHELCRCAAMNNFIGMLKKNQSEDTNETNNENGNEILNCIRKCDFEVAFDKMEVKNLANKKRYDFSNLFK